MSTSVSLETHSPAAPDAYATEKFIISRLSKLHDPQKILEASAKYLKHPNRSQKFRSKLYLIAARASICLEKWKTANQLAYAGFCSSEELQEKRDFVLISTFTYNGMENWDFAIKSAHTGLQLPQDHNSSSYFYYYLARAHIAVKELEDACHAIYNGLATLPSHSEGREEELEHSRIVLGNIITDWVRPLEVIKKHLKHRQNTNLKAKTHLCKAVANNQIGKFEKAIRVAQKGLNLNPSQKIKDLLTREINPILRGSQRALLS